MASHGINIFGASVDSDGFKMLVYRHGPRRLAGAIEMIPTRAYRAVEQRRAVYTSCVTPEGRGRVSVRTSYRGINNGGMADAL